MCFDTLDKVSAYNFIDNLSSDKLSLASSRGNVCLTGPTHRGKKN